MLVLTRNPGQGFKVEGPCRVVVLRTDGAKVRLGIEADRQVLILRDEVRREEFAPEPGPIPGQFVVREE